MRTQTGDRRHRRSLGADAHPALLAAASQPVHRRRRVRRATHVRLAQQRSRVQLWQQLLRAAWLRLQNQELQGEPGTAAVAAAAAAAAAAATARASGSFVSGSSGSCLS